MKNSSALARIVSVVCFALPAMVVVLVRQWSSAEKALAFAAIAAISLVIWMLTGRRTSTSDLMKRCWNARCILWAIAAAGLAIFGCISYFFFEHMPFVSDCIVEFAQARLYTQGHLTWNAPPPEVAPFLNCVYSYIHHGIWRSQFFPGGILLIALGDFFRASWLVNPLLGAGSLMLVHAIGASLYGRNTGRLAAVLLLCSPMFILIQSEMMSHGATLFFSLAGFYLLCCPQRKSANCGAGCQPASCAPDVRALKAAFVSEWLGGFCLGIALITRPLSALPAAMIIIAAPPMVWASNPYRGGRKWFAAAAGGILPIAFLMYDNYVATQSIWHCGYQFTNTELHQLGFRDSFRLPVAIEHCVSNLTAWNEWFLGWPISSFLSVAALFILGVHRKTLQRSDLLLLAMTVLLIVLYFFYAYQDTWFGPRFLYESLGWMAILAARGCAEMYRWLKERLPQWSAAQVANWCALALVPFLLAGPLRATELFRERGYKNLMNNRRESLLEPIERAGILNNPKAVVFVSTIHPEIVFMWNTAFFPTGPLFPKDMGDQKNATFMKAFPGRVYYRLDGKGNLTALPQMTR